MMPKFTFPKKVYLSGPDCFYLVLEANAQKHQTGNNVVRMVLHFEDDVKAKQLIENAHQSPLVHWLCNITLQKGFLFFKPYWKYADAGNKLKITEHVFGNDHGIPSEILNRNIPLQNSCLLEFDLIKYTSNKTTLIISWNHILMDGRGSGLFIRHLDNPSVVDEKTFPRFFPSSEKKISLFKYIKNMYEVKAFIEKSSQAPIATVASEVKPTNKTFKLKTFAFSTAETETITNNALNNGAKFGANAFLMACCAQAVNTINNKNNKKDTIWLPAPYDGRKRGAQGPIISNCIFFLFYRISPNDLTSIKQTVACINKQMAEQLKIDMPKKYNMLLNMMRHIPLKINSFLTMRSSKGVVASFLFSSAGDSFRDMSGLLNDTISEINIIPPFTYPPGLTFSFLRQNNLLKMNLLYCENNFNTDELSLLESSVQNNLLQNYS
ncbi:hypothetical protein [Aurantibacillus circumpalustris]|uniref:hypothetical protein n=1 Tax=Aurantibacillus circumpalustris TaxID=3036359 RepID=UPI00295B7CFC|nr:hypothetical protein [Aurantibacillus circumpalustris]